jgi:hypothetical protein
VDYFDKLQATLCTELDRSSPTETFVNKDGNSLWPLYGNLNAGKAKAEVEKD